MSMTDQQINEMLASTLRSGITLQAEIRKYINDLQETDYSYPAWEDVKVPETLYSLLSDAAVETNKITKSVTKCIVYEIHSRELQSLADSRDLLTDEWQVSSQRVKTILAQYKDILSQHKIDMDRYYQSLNHIHYLLSTFRA